MDTQLNALPTLPVRARPDSGCWNSAFLGLGLERNRSAVGKTKAPLVAGGPQQLTPAAPYSPPPSLNEPLHGGNVPVTRRACVGLALLSLRVTSGLPKSPLLPRHSIYVLKQTACRPAASFKKPEPERPQRLAVKPSSAPALRVQASSFLYQSRPKLFRPLMPSSARGIDGGLHDSPR
jgi:hypothetical protein